LAFSATVDIGFVADGEGASYAGFTASTAAAGRITTS
jgi:hypothetical protein